VGARWGRGSNHARKPSMKAAWPSTIMTSQSRPLKVQMSSHQTREVIVLSACGSCFAKQRLRRLGPAARDGSARLSLTHSGGARCYCPPMNHLRDNFTAARSRNGAHNPPEKSKATKSAIMVDVQPLIVAWGRHVGGWGLIGTVKSPPRESKCRLTILPLPPEFGELG
jgi:hypothetical protein